MGRSRAKNIKLFSSTIVGKWLWRGVKVRRDLRKGTLGPLKTREVPRPHSNFVSFGPSLLVLWNHIHFITGLARSF